LSPILAFTVLNVFQGAAAALPAPEPRTAPAGRAGGVRLLGLPALKARRAAAKAE
jgi:hypothetical protein